MQVKHNIYFLTLRTHSEIKRFPIIRSIEPVIEALRKTDSIGFDREFTNLDPILAEPLLSQIATPEVAFIIDDVSIDLGEILKDFTHLQFIGHNIKIDYQMTKLNNNIVFRNVWDTMIVDQRLSLGSGRSNALEATVERRLGIRLDKSRVKLFIGMTPDSTITDEHLEYAIEDVLYLHNVRESQRKSIEKHKHELLLYDIEFPLVSLIGDTELEGMILLEKWKEQITYNEKIRQEIEIGLDKILLEIYENQSGFEEHEGLKPLVPVLRRKRRYEKTYKLDLFEDSAISKNANARFINYNSSKQVLDIFRLLGLWIPTAKKKDAKTGVKKVINSVSEEALQQYIIDYDTVLTPFIKELLKLKGVIKGLDSFGERFLVSKYKVYKGGRKDQSKIGFKNPVTGKVHTLYKQAMTETGRLASGNEKIGKFNSQNVPKDNRYRTCFGVEEGFEVVTADLSGAELVIGASLSGDKRLLELVAGDDPDVHSPLAEICYDEITSYILNNIKGERQRKELEELYEAAEYIYGDERHEITQKRVKEVLETGHFVLNKETAKDIRDKFKNVSYALPYGGGVERIMDILNMANAYATIVESTLKNELPDFFKYLEGSAKQGVENGVVYFNSRTNSRRWFPKAMEANSRRQRLSFADQGAIERESKNAGIQGCLQGHSKVLTELGYIEISKIHRKMEKPMKVWNGNKWCEFNVLDRGSCQLAQVHLSNGLMLDCDTRHELLVVTEERSSFKKVTELTSEDKVAMSMPEPMDVGIPPQSFSYKAGVHNSISFDYQPDSELFYWIGRYLGDGNMYDYRLVIVFSTKPSDLEALARAETYFAGFNPKVRKVKENLYEFTVNSKGLVKLIEAQGFKQNKTAKTKRIPNSIFSLPLEYRKELVRGFMGADGWLGSRITLHLAQREILVEMMRLLRTCGVASRLHGPYKYKEFTSYRLDISKRLYLEHMEGIKTPNTYPQTYATRAMKERFAEHYKYKRNLFKTGSSERSLFNRMLVHDPRDISVYKLKEMDIEGAIEIYDYDTFEKLVVLEEEAVTYTLEVKDLSHRFDSEGIISKNTQADMLKEATVDYFYQYIQPNNLEERVKFLLFVHDEIAIKIPKGEHHHADKLKFHMSQAANRYLIPSIKMGAEYKIRKTWIK
ncbi:hypothetical protein LCGC14_0245950 [marine sediment metagenome]|uniref:DOD-type homing endonuclease domain-containing protein n=1 Tax=marine sediment metagenome TaxID=412755 RepID=A0A0F9UAL9_9ZZZZ